MPTNWVQASAMLIMLSAASIAFGFKLALPRNSKARRSSFEPAWLSPLIAMVSALLGIATLWAIIHPRPPLNSSVFFRLGLPGLGFLAGVLGCGLMYWCLATLGRNFSGTSGTYPSHELITSGPYHFIRHPYYTATALIIISLTLLLGSLTLLGLGSLLLMCLAVRSRAEELELLALFGEHFKRWGAQTGRFFPKMHSNRTSQSRT